MKLNIVTYFVISILLVVTLILLYQSVQIQNQLFALTELKKEFEAPNVLILTYSWQDQPWTTTQNMFSLNCTLFNTGFQTAYTVSVKVTFNYEGGKTEDRLLDAPSISGRQTVTLTNIRFTHNNMTISYITIEAN